jgi:peptidylprolyl isomerase
MSFIILGVLLLGTILGGGCTGGSTAQSGDVVRVHYTGKLLDDSVFDSSVGAEPLEFTLGAGMMIPGFDNAVLGMKVGENKTITIPYTEAYGAYQEELVAELDRSLLAADAEPYVGQQMQMALANGGVMSVVIIAVSATTITIDANHFLAGQDLIFAIELVEIVET